MHENEVVFQQKPYGSGNGPAVQFWQMENASRMSHILDSRAVSLVFVWTRRSLPWFCPKEEALWSQWWSNECFHNRYFKQVIGKFRFFFQTTILHHVVLLFLLQHPSWNFFLHPSHCVWVGFGSSVSFSHWQDDLDARLPGFRPW